MLAYIAIVIGSISVRIGYVKANTKPQWLKTTKVYFLPPMHANHNQQEIFGAPTISNVGEHRGRMVSNLQNNIPVQTSHIQIQVGREVSH